MRNFLTGLGLGLGVGMLIAPQSGEETRDQLRARIGAIGSRAEEAGDELRERLAVQHPDRLSAGRFPDRDRPTEP